MKPQETLEAAQMTFDQARAEQAMIDGLRARREGLVAQLDSLVNHYPGNGEDVQVDPPSSKAFLFQAGEVEGRHRRIFVTATVINDAADGVRKAGLNFYAEVEEDEGLGQRKLICLETLDGNTVRVIEFMSEYLPLLGDINPNDVRDRVENEPKVREIENLEESLTQLYSLNPLLLQHTELATN